MTLAPTWPGCHGVRMHGAALELGIGSGVPLADATVRLAAVAPVDAPALWVQEGEIASQGEVVHVERSLHRRADGLMVLVGNRGPALEIDPAARTICVGEGDRAAARQLVATFALPLLVQPDDALFLHAAACAHSTKTVLLCGDSGAGKSSLLVALTNAGWQPVSEDLCAVDHRSDPVVWPGPPWVRVARAGPGPHGAAKQFDALDKTGWDIGARQPNSPQPLRYLVLLRAPGGAKPELVPVSPADAMRALARSALWLVEPDERGRRLFAPTAAVASKVPALSLRLPYEAGWTDAAVELLAGLP